MRIEDVPVPKPNADQVLIKVVVSGSNPKDWKVSKHALRTLHFTPLITS